MSENRRNNGEVNDGKFKKGQPRPPGAGRRRGQRNHISIALKDAIILAAEEAGYKVYNKKTRRYDIMGQDGLIGYVRHLALRREELFVPLLAKVLPMHVTVAAVQNRKYRTEEEVRQLCAERGVPFEDVLDIAEIVPTKLIDVTPDHEPEKR
jgi:hypothetical protein